MTLDMQWQCQLKYAPPRGQKSCKTRKHSWQKMLWILKSHRKYFKEITHSCHNFDVKISNPFAFPRYFLSNFIFLYFPHFESFYIPYFTVSVHFSKIYSVRFNRNYLFVHFKEIDFLSDFS